MSRFFEKISFEQFKKDVNDSEELYNSIVLPKRSTMHSAGYDIRSVEDCVIKPGEAKNVKTGIKACMNDDEVLFIYSRSSQGFKYNVCLANSVGVVDADFYNNDVNEGHINIRLINFGDKDYIVNIGDRIAQGVFAKYLLSDKEEKINKQRTGWSGYISKEEEQNE